jgi:predicted dehydrogenase
VAIRPAKVVLVGIGKIARDQHIPTLKRSPNFELVGAISTSQPDVGVPVFKSIEQACATLKQVDAVSICTPPAVREQYVYEAAAAGCAIMLEKPPAVTVAEALRLRDICEGSTSTLYASWHSRHAAGVQVARSWASEHKVKSGRVIWHESARKWHPGQRWLWEPGGFGVYDPGINALSILTEIFPAAYSVSAARHEIPANAETPVAADLSLTADGVPISVSFDFRREHDERWEIALSAETGETLLLSQGGAQVSISGRPLKLNASDEYQGVYSKWSELIRAGECSFDLMPLEIIESANSIAERHAVDPIYN